MSKPRVISLILAALFGTGSAFAAPVNPRLQNVRTWAFALGEGMLDEGVVARFAGYDLAVVDGEDVRPGQVAALMKKGTVVLAYLSVGTIERWRWWYAQVKAYRLEYWGDWGEWYADVSKDGFRDVMVESIAPWILDKGVDGLFLDNTDMIESHPARTTGMRILVRRLSRLVRSKGKLLFTQNGEASIGPTLDCYDGWNREDVTWTYDFDAEEYRRMPAADTAGALAAMEWIGGAGLLVTSTDYTKRSGGTAESLCVRNACRAGAVPFVSDIDLSRLPGALLSCPASGAARR